MLWSRNAQALAIAVFGGVMLLILPNSAAPQNTAQNSSPPPQQSVARPQPVPPPLVMIDAAHGGSEPGALLNPAVPEKDVTLVFARKLRQELALKGVSSQLLRDNDGTMSTDQRAEIVNSARPILYICVHASSLGKGLRFFTTMPLVANDSRGPFISWQAAQGIVAARALAAQQQIASAIQKSGLLVRTLPAPLRPLNNIAVPALAIEIAPNDGNVSQLTSTDYQQITCTMLANAIIAALPGLQAKTVSP